jgi:RHS repeat-associated protein
LSSNFTYDDLNRLKALNAYQYQLGPTGNRQSATEPNGRTLNWTYDGIYRLTNETINGASVNYTLDPVGNRQSQTSSIPGIPTAGPFTYDADDRLSTETYDNNGNTLTTGNRTFTYDFENRLKTMNGTAVALVYDGDGNRVGKTANGVTTQYLVDDLNPTGYAQVVEELVSGAVTRTYTYGLRGIDESQLASGAWTPSFYSYDGDNGGGNIRILTDAAGTVTDTYDYDAWGNAVNTTGSTPNTYRYRGEQYDPDLSLYYLRARYFNPLSGRFLTKDPQAGNTHDVASLHQYLYAAADPIGKIDPTGRSYAPVATGPSPSTSEWLTLTTLVTGTALLALSSNPAGVQEVWHTLAEFLDPKSEINNTCRGRIQAQRGHAYLAPAILWSQPMAPGSIQGLAMLLSLLVQPQLGLANMRDLAPASIQVAAWMARCAATGGCGASLYQTTYQGKGLNGARIDVEVKTCRSFGPW